jgi:hypothetical protein
MMYAQRAYEILRRLSFAQESEGRVRMAEGCVRMAEGCLWILKNARMSEGCVWMAEGCPRIPKDTF